MLRWPIRSHALAGAGFASDSWLVTAAFAGTHRIYGVLPLTLISESNLRSTPIYRCRILSTWRHKSTQVSFYLCYLLSVKTFVSTCVTKWKTSSGCIQMRNRSLNSQVAVIRDRSRSGLSCTGYKLTCRLDSVKRIYAHLLQFISRML